MTLVALQVNEDQVAYPKGGETARVTECGDTKVASYLRKRLDLGQRGRSTITFTNDDWRLTIDD